MTEGFNRIQEIPPCPRCGAAFVTGSKACVNCGLPVAVQEQTSFSQTQPRSFAQQPVKERAVEREKQLDAPLRVIAMEKKYTLVACLKDLLLPGHGFLYTEKMTEGAIVGLVTIPLTVWGVIYYMQLWFTDLLTNAMCKFAQATKRSN